MRKKRSWYKYVSLHTWIVEEGWEYGVYQIIHGDGTVGSTNFRMNKPRREQKRDRRKSYNQEYKERAYEILGGMKCIRCGFSDPRALELDHINSDGYIDRIKGKNGGRNPYKWIIQHPEEAKRKFQVLCANCNRIKMWEENEQRKKANRRYN